MLSWKKLGPKLSTEQVFRARELLKQRCLPFRMPSDDMFFFSPYHLPHPDLRWDIRVRRRDWPEAIALLEREGLLYNSGHAQ